MLINEVSKLTKLTKKAIEYYTLQGLVFPSVSENGYRIYNAQDIKKLNKISVLRKLDISIDEISIELQSIEQSRTITGRLLEAFPGYYGRFICMHFARFLNQPIKTKSQQLAYETILSFLDSLPTFDIPKDLEEYLIEWTKHIGTEQIAEMLEATKKSYQNPDVFLFENKKMLEQYLEYKKSDEYKNSPTFKLMKLMKSFNSSNGYNDIFIPAMKQLSSSYAEYYGQMEVANKKLLEQYPEIQKPDNLSE